VAFALSYSAIPSGIVARLRGLFHPRAQWTGVAARARLGGAAHVPVADRMAATDQWATLSNVLAGATRGAMAAERLQVSATQQLDLAQYGLLTLIDELSEVMVLPGRKSRTATLHTLAQLGDVPYGPPAQQALAA
jgi:hypothetical protein